MNNRRRINVPDPNLEFSSGLAGNPRRIASANFPIDLAADANGNCYCFLAVNFALWIRNFSLLSSSAWMNACRANFLSLRSISRSFKRLNNFVAYLIIIVSLKKEKQDLDDTKSVLSTLKRIRPSGTAINFNCLIKIFRINERKTYNKRKRTWRASSIENWISVKSLHIYIYME